MDGLHVSSGDIDDCFHRSRVSREFSECFALESVTAGELGLSHLEGVLLEWSAARSSGHVAQRCQWDSPVGVLGAVGLRRNSEKGCGARRLGADY